MHVDWADGRANASGGRFKAPSDPQIYGQPLEAYQGLFYLSCLEAVRSWGF